MRLFVSNRYNASTKILAGYDIIIKTMKEDGAMNFIRARGEEQKKIRIQQIVDAAAGN